VTPAIHRHLTDALLASAVFAAAFLYRFNTLGGALGGFTNDQFGYLARARQIQAGEIPYRDFNDPGWFLTDYASAAAQWIGGYNLRSEAILTIGMLSLGAAVTYLLARRVAGSASVALFAVALQVALEPRHYNYPKIVVYALGLACAWLYVRRPGRAAAALFAVLTAVAFLFRHDHLVYLGALGLLTMTLVHQQSLRHAARAAVPPGIVLAVCLTPFLLFLSVSGGVGEYFRSAFLYISRDAERTSFSLPRLSLDFSRPLVLLTREGPAGVAVNVRWAGASDEARAAREARYQLAEGVRQDGTTWRYQLRDTSTANIEALVRDPLVEDTHGIDRSAFAVDVPPLRLVSQFDDLENATAYLYYFLLVLPLVGAVVLGQLLRAGGPTRVTTTPALLVPLLVLAALLNGGFLSRGSTNIRIPDVGVTAGVLLAWLIVAIASRDARLIVPARGARTVVRAAALVVLTGAVLSANGLTQLWRHLDQAYFESGAGHPMRRAAEVWTELGVPPPVMAAHEDQPETLHLATYVSACTEPRDRLFVLGHYPELYYFADRRFGGGHAWLLPLYYTDTADEMLIVERLERERVPIIITEAEHVYLQQYRPVFERLHAFLQTTYRDAGNVDVDGADPLRILVRRDLVPTGSYEPLRLPCFAHA
jgi:hypothetical protein